MQARPEVVRPPEVEIPAEIPAPTSVTRGFGSARPDFEAVAMPVDKPETDPTYVFPVRTETFSGDPENLNHTGYNIPNPSSIAILFSRNLSGSYVSENNIKSHTHTRLFINSN